MKKQYVLIFFTLFLGEFISIGCRYALKASPTLIPIATSSTTVPGIQGLSYSPDGRRISDSL